MSKDDLIKVERIGLINGKDVVRTGVLIFNEGDKSFVELKFGTREFTIEPVFLFDEEESEGVRTVWNDSAFAIELYVKKNTVYPLGTSRPLVMVSYKDCELSVSCTFQIMGTAERHTATFSYTVLRNKTG